MAEKESPVCPGVSAMNVNKHICVIKSSPAKNLEGFICLQKLPQRRKTLADRGCTQRREKHSGLSCTLHTSGLSGAHSNEGLGGRGSASIQITFVLDEAANAEASWGLGRGAGFNEFS